MTSQALAQRPATQIQQGEGSRPPLVVFRAQLEQRATEFQAALPSHISAEKFQRTVLTAVQSDPDLLTADRQSLITSCMKAAQDGLLPDKREAALVIFTTSVKNPDGTWSKRKLCQYMPMVYGLRKKILQSGEVKDIQANVVYRQEVEAGLFVYEEGTERMLRHKPCLDPDFDPTDADIVLAYSIATFNDGSMSFEVMRRSDINKVRNVSQTGALIDKKGQPRTPSGPWVDWFAEQAKKTVIRRHSKSLPMSGDIIDVEAMDTQAASRSAVGLLGSVDADAPEAIAPPTRAQLQVVDHDDTAHDPATGEVVENGGQTQAAAGASDAPTFEEAESYVRAAGLVIDVNSRLAEVVQHFGDEDADSLRSAAAERIDELSK